MKLLGMEGTSKVVRRLLANLHRERCTRQCNSNSTPPAKNLDFDNDDGDDGEEDDESVGDRMDSDTDDRCL